MREYRIAARLAFWAVGLALANSDIAQNLRPFVRFYLLHLVMGISLKMIGMLAGCSKQNVSQQIKKIEALAENDPALEAQLEAMETQILNS